METTQLSFKRWLDKDVVHGYSGICLSHKDEILPFVTTWAGWESIVLSEISQMEKNKDCMSSLLLGIWNKKQQMNKQNRKPPNLYI